MQTLPAEYLGLLCTVILQKLSEISDKYRPMPQYNHTWCKPSLTEEADTVSLCLPRLLLSGISDHALNIILCELFATLQSLQFHKEN